MPASTSVPRAQAKGTVTCHEYQSWASENGSETADKDGCCTCRVSLTVTKVKTELCVAGSRSAGDVGLRRLAELGYLSTGRAESIWRTFSEFEATPGSWMITSGQLEIIAAPAK
jgi:hypothetical protein